MREKRETTRTYVCVSSQGMPSSGMVLGVLSLPLSERHHPVYHHRSEALRTLPMFLKEGWRSTVLLDSEAGPWM